MLGDDAKSSMECAKSISHCFVRNKSLHHVDLTSNNFNKECSTLIAEGLDQNKHIYGIHFRGNYGYVNAKGFLILEDKEITTLQSFVQPNIESYEVLFRR